jgi:hypothetical protein
MAHFVTYKCQRYYVQSTGIYYASGNTRQHVRLLHRQIWTDHFGEIPEGHHIHHKDGDWRNNDISNLECISASEHGREHMNERFKDEQYRKQNKIDLAKAQDKAKLWHKSEEGRKWHREHGKKTWENKKTIKKSCQHCGNEFQAYFDRAKFCSRKCIVTSAKPK